jgi:hypothetical protein
MRLPVDFSRGVTLFLSITKLSNKIKEGQMSLACRTREAVQEYIYTILATKPDTKDHCPVGI